MKIINPVNMVIVADKVKLADNFLTRLVGLLSRSGFDDGEGLIITPCRSIHSFGMRFDFDAVFVSKNNEIVHLIEQMRPGCVSPVVKASCKVIELPANTVKRCGLKDGIILEFVEDNK